MIVPHRIIRSWYTGRWWVGCYTWYSEEGPGRAAAPPRPIIAVPNVTAHPSTASIPITVLLYDGPLLCGLNVAMKGLMTTSTVDTTRKYLMCSNKLRNKTTARDQNRKLTKKKTARTRNLAIANMLRSASCNIPSGQIRECSNHCSHMTSDCCNWLRTLHMRYRKWNRL